MIYSLIILISSLFIVHSFYIMNVAVIEECTTGLISYLTKFDSTKMRCLNKVWRQGTIALEYSCINNVLKREWTVRTSVNPSASWPPDIFIFTTKEYKLHGRSVQQQNLILDEYPSSFDPNNNQLTSYLWTGTDFAPNCRFKYTVTKDICTTNKGKKLAAKFTDVICYYGKQHFEFHNIKHKDAFNKLVDDKTKPNSNTAQKNTTTKNPNTGGKDPNLSALNADKTTFWMKNKLYILGIGGGVIVIIIASAIIFFTMCRQQTPIEDLEEPRTSDVDLNIEETDLV